MTALSGDERLHVTSRPGEDALTLDLLVGNVSVIKVQPAKTGELKQALLRIAKKLKIAEDKVQLLQGCGVDFATLDDTSPNAEAWTATNSYLVLEDRRIPVSLNCPAVLELAISKRVLVSCPVLPKVRIEFCDESATTYRWLRAPAVDGATVEPLVVGEGCEYVPKNEDVGHVLLCEATPKRGGDQGLPVRTSEHGAYAEAGAAPAGKKSKGKKEAPRKVVVEALPSSWPFEARHQEAARRGPPNAGMLRVCTYNILVDQFCNTEWPRENLYWYTNREFLDVNYRVALIAKELQGYKASVLCLQEVEGRVFTEVLEPLLERMGMAARYSPKGESSTWGCAVAWNKALMSLNLAETVSFSDREEWAKDPEVARVCGDAAVEEIMLSGAQIGQILTMEMAQGKPLVVANTHLFGNPDAPHVRIMQMQLLLRSVAQACANADRGEGTACVICGDLNSDPISGTMELALRGAIEAWHPEWAEGSTFKNLKTRNEREDEFFSKLSSKDIDTSRAAFRHLAGGSMAAQVDLAAVQCLFRAEGMGTAAALCLHDMLADHSHQGVGYAGWHELVKTLKTSDPIGFEASFAKLILQAHALAPAPCEGDDANMAEGFGAELRHPLSLESAFEEVEATFCGGGKAHAVDVILHSGFHNADPFALFSRHDLMKEGGIPTAGFPSDHASLLCDLHW